jgi:hypothetical protein
MHRFFRWFFQNRETGAITIAQAPNLSLWMASAAGGLIWKKSFCTGDQTSLGRRRDFRVKMWGSSSPDDKLTGNLGNVIQTTRIGGRPSDRFMAWELPPGNFGLFQQHRPIRDTVPFSRGRKQCSFTKLTAALTRPDCSTFDCIFGVNL